MIHCIGDSHAQFFSGNGSLKSFFKKKLVDRIPSFKTYIIGPVLAYNLKKVGTTSQGREKLFKILQNIDKKDWIMLIFGEIDCRAQIIKQVKASGKNKDTVIKQCVKNYTQAIKQIQRMGFSKIIVWEAIPSTPFDENIKDYPIYGTCRERNEVTRLFNSRVRYFAKRNKIHTLSIFNNLVDNNGLTNKNYFLDEIHLSPRALPTAVKKLKTLHIESLEIFNNAFLNRLPEQMAMLIFITVCTYSHFHGQLFRRNPWLLINPMSSFS